MPQTLLGQTLPVEVLNFDKLPDDSRIPSASMQMMCGIKSNTSLWRRKKQEEFPKPDKYNTCRVGDIRKYLASIENR